MLVTFLGLYWQEASSTKRLQANQIAAVPRNHQVLCVWLVMLTLTLDNKFPVFSKARHPGNILLVQRALWGLPLRWWCCGSLMGLGLRGAVSGKRHQPSVLFTGLSLLGRLPLEIVYGDEGKFVLIPSCHFLVVLAAWARLRARMLALVLAGTLVAEVQERTIFLQFNQNSEKFT